ncbi:ROK family protein [Corynebacterium sp. SCR221107]|uniref:ROK family protein n=1 Tax=Corynebacterium sp. SCR221107 TaxID=3017361 RepID=UPI0022EC6A6C|nr:ROK family protein [Corynebacterium sp. SCR221107]WBT08799.1 ROK family protein [Corynebacterium sp. SCR221107]
MTTAIKNRSVYFSFPSTPVARVFHQIRTTTSDRTLLQKQLGYSQASITRHVGALIDAGLVEETSPKAVVDSRAGRPRITLGINGRHLVFWGAHIGVSSTEIVIADAGGRTLRHKRLSLATTRRSPEEQIDTVARELAALGHDLADPIDIGVAFSSHVTRDGVLNSTEYGWHDVDIATILEQAFGRPVPVTTGVLAMAGSEVTDTPLSEANGLPAPGANPVLPSTLYFYAREVVSHAWIFNGVVHQPHSGKAPSAFFAGRGALDAHGPGEQTSPLSVAPILDEATRLGLRASNFADLVALSAHSPSIRKRFEERAVVLSDAVAAAVDVVDPEVVVFAGEAFTLDPATLKSTVARLRDCAHTATRLRIQQAGHNIISRAAIQVALNRFRADPLQFV